MHDPSSQRALAEAILVWVMQAQRDLDARSLAGCLDADQYEAARQATIAEALRRLGYGSLARGR